MYPKTATETTKRRIMASDVFEEVETGEKEPKAEDPGGEQQCSHHCVFPFIWNVLGKGCSDRGEWFVLFCLSED